MAERWLINYVRRRQKSSLFRKNLQFLVTGVTSPCNGSNYPGSRFVRFTRDTHERSFKSSPLDRGLLSVAPATSSPRTSIPFFHLVHFYPERWFGLIFPVRSAAAGPTEKFRRPGMAASNAVCVVIGEHRFPTSRP